MIRFNLKENKGFIILYAVVVSAIIALLTAGIFSVALRQGQLSTTSRESVKAFFAADAGLECAFYHDIKQGGFTAGPSIAGAVQCLSGVEQVNYQTVNIDGRDIDVYDFIYMVNEDDERDGCAVVIVRKGINLPGAGLITEITSRGFNSCIGVNSDSGIVDPLVVERRLKAWYPGI